MVIRTNSGKPVSLSRLPGQTGGRQESSSSLQRRVSNSVSPRTRRLNCLMRCSGASSESVDNLPTFLLPIELSATPLPLIATILVTTNERLLSESRCWGRQRTSEPCVFPSVRHRLPPASESRCSRETTACPGTACATHSTIASAQQNPKLNVLGFTPPLGAVRPTLPRGHSTIAPLEDRKTRRSKKDERAGDDFRGEEENSPSPFRPSWTAGDGAAAGSGGGNRRCLRTCRRRHEVPSGDTPIFARNKSTGTYPHIFCWNGGAYVLGGGECDDSSRSATAVRLPQARQPPHRCWTPPTFETRRLPRPPKTCPTSSSTPNSETS